MKSSGGFTILEVVVATGLLSLGVVGILTLQTQAMRSQQRVRVLRELVAVAEAEVERRASAHPSTDSACEIPVLPFLLECRSTREECASAVVVCGGPSAARAARIAVFVRADGGQEFELQTLTANFPPP